MTINALGTSVAWALSYAPIAGVRDLFVPDQQPLQLRRRDLESFVLDELFDSISDVEVALGILEPDIACPEVSVVCERVGGGGGVVEIAGENVGPFDPQLAGRAGRKGGFGGRHVLGCLVGEETADGADGGMPVVISLYRYLC